MYLTAAAAKDSFIYAPSITRKKPIEYSLDKAVIGSGERIAERKKNEARTSDNDSFCAQVNGWAKASVEGIAQAKSDFGDMYVTSAARKYYEEEFRGYCSTSEDYLNSLISYSRKAVRAGKEAEAVYVPIEGGQLPVFMDYLQKALAEGKSFKEALEVPRIEHLKSHGASGNLNEYADWFYIDPENGDVVYAGAKSRMIDGDKWRECRFTDDEAALELADDLATFLRYAVFSQDGDDPERVQRLISYIKDKQAYANYDRYICDEGDDTDLLSALIEAGVLKSDEDEKENQIDELMETLKLHQEAMNTERTERNRVIFVKEELQELLAERSAIAANPVSVYAPVRTAKPPLRITALENRVSAGVSYEGEDTEELLKKLIEAWISTDDEEEKRRRKIRPKSADDKFMNMVLMRDEKMKGIKRARNTVLKIEQDQFDDIFKHLEDNTNPETTEIKIETEAKTAAQTEKEAETEAEARENVGDQAS